jgi:hypothetical protein
MSRMPSLLVPRPDSDRLAAPYITPTFGDALRVWWAFSWRNILLGYAGDFFYSNDVNFGVMPTTFITGILAMYWILGKNFRNFRLALVPPEVAASNREPSPDQILPANFRRSLRVWWAYSWRALAFTLVLYIVGSIPLGVLLVASVAISPLFGEIIGRLVQLLVWGGVGLFVFYNSILDETFSDFRVVLLPRRVRAPSDAVVPVPSATVPPQPEA